MSVEVVDTELLELRKIKSQLVEKAAALRNRLAQQETKRYESDLKLNKSLVDNKQNISDANSGNTKKVQQILCDATSTILGITCENLDKKWLHDDIYLYTTNVKTKALYFLLKLTVDLRNEVNFEIIDITCNFLNTSVYRVLEITSWVQHFIKLKNLSYFMSAASDYTEKNIVRADILEGCSRRKLITAEPYTEEDGGILIHVHSLRDAEQVYLDVRWVLQFSDRTWYIEHYFVIESTKAGYDFVKNNEALLQRFCQLNLVKHDLKLLWNKLYAAIETYDREITQ